MPGRVFLPTLMFKQAQSIITPLLPTTIREIIPTAPYQEQKLQLLLNENFL